MPTFPPKGPFRRARVTLVATSLVALLACGTIAALPSVHAESLASAGDAPQLPSLSPLVKRVMPAVVNISVQEGAVEDSADTGESDAEPGPLPGFPQGSPFDEFLKRFFQNQGMGPNGPEMARPHQQMMALGSGFIIDPSGLVVTNNHVVKGAKKVTVVLQDGSEHVAKILGRDPKTDLALLKITADHALPYVSWGNSDREEVGDWVVAVGNPFGLGGTVSAGILSARGRDIHSGPYDDYLQIDAPINRGNSGGPTFDLKGEVIGINTAIYSPNGGSVGIGFAIPASLARPVIEQLRAHGTVSRGWLGVQIQAVTPAIAKNLGLASGHGALVADVAKDGPAEKAGIKQGDVIESFNGHEVAAMRELPITVAETPIGSEAKVKVWRNGQEKTFSLTIAELPENLQMAANEAAGPAQSEQSSALGLTLQPLTQKARQELHVAADLKGVVVRAIADSSPLAELGLQPGDVIVSINRQAVTTPGEAVAKLKTAVAEKSLLVLVNRHGANEYVAWSEQPSQG